MRCNRLELCRCEWLVPQPLSFLSVFGAKLDDGGIEHERLREVRAFFVMCSLVERHRAIVESLILPISDSHSLLEGRRHEKELALQQETPIDHSLELARHSLREQDCRHVDKEEDAFEELGSIKAGIGCRDSG